MSRRNLGTLAAVLLVVAAVPALAQMGFSEAYSFLKAVRERDSSTVNGILANPSTTAINARGDDGQGALHILVRGRDSTWLSFLLSRGARPDIQDNEGTTPLMVAAQIGWIEGADLLLRNGANPNLSNSRGETPLMFAVHNVSLPMVRLLMNHHANPNQTDNVQGYSALDYARQDRRASAIVQALSGRGIGTPAPATAGPQPR